MLKGFNIKHVNVIEFKDASYNSGNIHFTSDKVPTFYAFFKAKRNNLASHPKVVTST